MDISSENLELVTYKRMGEKYACFLIKVCVCKSQQLFLWVKISSDP